MKRKYVFITAEYIGHNDKCFVPLLHKRKDDVIRIKALKSICTDENFNIIHDIETEFMHNGLEWLNNMIMSTIDEVIIILPNIQFKNYMISYINKSNYYQNNRILINHVNKAIVLIEYMKIQNKVDNITDGYDESMTVIYSRFYAMCGFEVSKINDNLLEFIDNKASMSMNIMKRVVEVTGIENILHPSPKDISPLTKSIISRKIESKVKSNLVESKHKDESDDNSQETYTKDMYFKYQIEKEDVVIQMKLYVSRHAIDRYMERDFRTGRDSKIASEIYDKFRTAKFICDVGDGLVEYYLAEGMLLLVVRNVSINTKRILTVLKPTKQKMDAIKEIMILQRRLEGRLSKESFDECNRNLNSYKMVLVGDDFKDYMYRKK